MTQQYDAVVIGGGPAGATAAFLLARSGWSVAVVERKSFPRAKVCGEYLSATNLALLHELGVADRFHDQAGPEIKRVGLFAGSAVLDAALPRPSEACGWGRAWRRADLDTCLLEAASAAGADVLQPAAVVACSPNTDGYECDIRDDNRLSRTMQAGILIAANGSWEAGTLPAQLPRLSPRPADLLGFKAYFQATRLPSDLMPLVCFPGGYGGMVGCTDGCVSFSLCIRRDRLARVRQDDDAGDAVLRHIRSHCVGVDQVLQDAERVGRWLAAGPIRPGIRLPRRDGCFAVGNAAGEAHPVIAEGISMAMQSAWLLAETLSAWRQRGADRGLLPEVQRQYARAWRRAFASRIRAAAIIARWAMRPIAVGSVLPLLRAWPGLLTWGSRWSGKTTVATFGETPIQEMSRA